MRIGILTFHRAHNYGAMLQAYAMLHVLSKLGYDVEFISYRQDHIENAYKVWRWKYNIKTGVVNNIKNLISSILTLSKRRRRKVAFVNFLNSYLPETKAYTKSEILSSKLSYDFVFFGSDQIWTTRFMGNFDDVYWGDIQLSEGKKIAYAPSMELSQLDQKQKEYIKKHLGNFDNVSARETSMACMLKDVSGIEIRTVLDPTLLCTKSDYADLIKNSSPNKNNKYVLLYQVGRYRQACEIASKISDYLNLPIIEIGSDILLHSEKSYKDCLSPSDFVSLIANATFVVSCSFHGTAFAVNFEVPFYSVLIQGSDARALSFLSQVDMLDRGIRCADDIQYDFLSDIDFTKSRKKLDWLRDKSYDYIKTSLDNV